LSPGEVNPPGEFCQSEFPIIWVSAHWWSELQAALANECVCSPCPA
jgi:hypothetical protein